MLQVLKLFLDSRDAPIKEIHFEGTLGPSFVTATQAEIDTAVDQFLGIQASSRAGQTAAPTGPVAPEAAPDQTPVAPATGKKAPAPPDPSDGPVDNTFSLTPTSYGKELAQPMRRREPKLPIYYPTGARDRQRLFAEATRLQDQRDRRGLAPAGRTRRLQVGLLAAGARRVLRLHGHRAGRTRRSSMTPDAERRIGDRDYKIYFDGDRVRMIAWQTDQGSFWLSNTLIESLSNGEMLKVAEGMKELPALAG